MSWTTPLTAIDGEILTAAQFNTSIRDNFMETAPAKATNNQYSFFAVTGTNSISERSSKFNTTTGTITESTNTSYFGTAPAVTVRTGTSALVFYGAEMMHSLGNAIRTSIEVSGATSIPPSNDRSLVTTGVTASNSLRRSGFFRFSPDTIPLTPGDNTFTMKYARSSGTGTWSLRHIIVIPI